MFTFATIVFGAEMPLLGLQARAFARHVPPALVQEILVLVNDRREAEGARQVAAIRTLYGPHADKLRIIPASTLLGRDRATPAGLWRRLRCAFPLLRLRRPQGGWRGNPGWLTQQALKLSVGRIATADHVIILDAKNIWLSEIAASDLLAEDGRALAQFIRKPGRNSSKWLPASFAAIGEPCGTLPAPITHYLTPYPVQRQLLCDTVERLEQVNGSVEAAFLLRNPYPTEFCAINAVAYAKYGGIEPFFKDGLGVCTPFAAADTPEHMDTLLDRMLEAPTKSIAIHTKAVQRMSEAQLAKLGRIFKAGGLLETAAGTEGLKNNLLFADGS